MQDGLSSKFYTWLEEEANDMSRLMHPKTSLTLNIEGLTQNLIQQNHISSSERRPKQIAVIKTTNDKILWSSW